MKYNYSTEARSRWGNTDAYREHERFKKNIDKYGEGTAEFAAEGTRIYVEKK